LMRDVLVVENAYIRAELHPCSMAAPATM
jgi:hypothetical protein